MLKGFNDFYHIGNKLGSGSYATVVKGVHKKENKSYAVKIVDRIGLDIVGEIDLLNEIDILQSLDHKYIISLLSVYAESEAYYLVTELANGGELFDRIIMKDFYNERDTRDLFKILLETIGFCHKKNIVHRDLKPENILLYDEISDTDIRIADFGLARRTSGPYSLRTQCGSPNYVAPEIIRGKCYGSKVDMWSIGVILYILLCGYMPFCGSEPKQLYRQVVRGDYSFHDEEWSGVSEDAKSLITCLLEINPEKRIDAKDALKHAWITNDGMKLVKFDGSNSLKKLKEFQARKSNTVPSLAGFSLSLKSINAGRHVVSRCA